MTFETGDVMRVIAGRAKGRVLKSVQGRNTRPTTDKVKESLFSMISPFLEGGNVLDLYAGTGALGIEALSRGMDYAVFVDKNKQSIDIIKENIEKCSFSEQSEVYKNLAERAVKVLSKRQMSFDLILLDPPYKMGVLETIISYLGEKEMVNENGIIAAEHDAIETLPDKIYQFETIKKSIYGNIGITVYQFINRI